MPDTELAFAEHDHDQCRETLLDELARAATGAEVVASIAPVHSLAARVMRGVGAPYLLLPPGASPPA